MATTKELQQLVNDGGYPHIKVLDKDTITALVDGEFEIFNREDIYSGHPLSGWANYGPVGGDHRMIRSIYGDIQEVFKILSV